MTAERAAYAFAYVAVFGGLALVSGLRAAAVILAALAVLEALTGELASAVVVLAFAWAAYDVAAVVRGILRELAR